MLTRANSLGAYVMMLGLVVLVGLMGLTLLGPALGNSGGGTITIAHQQQAAAIPEWLVGQQTAISNDLIINDHAEKHRDQKANAWILYSLLLEGQCVASAKFCSLNELEKLYICVDPVTGLVGGLFIIGDEIITGYGTRSFEYWDRTIINEFWEVCP